MVSLAHHPIAKTCGRLPQELTELAGNWQGKGNAPGLRGGNAPGFEKEGGTAASGGCQRWLGNGLGLGLWITRRSRARPVDNIVDKWASYPQSPEMPFFGPWRGFRDLDISTHYHAHDRRLWRDCGALAAIRRTKKARAWRGAGNKNHGRNRGTGIVLVTTL